MTLFNRNTLGVSAASSTLAFFALNFLMVATFALIASFSQAQAAFRQLPDSRVAIDLSDAFTPSDKFNGFVDKSTGASFAIIELPLPAYDKLKTIPESEEALAKEGFDGTKKVELQDRKGDYIYLVGEQETPAGEVTKFVLMFAGDEIAAVIVANVPQKAIETGTYSRESIEDTLTTVFERDAPDPNALFRFSYLGPFRKAYDHGGMTQAYNLSGNQPGSGGNLLVQDTMLMISSSIHGDEIDVKEQAKKSFLELGGMKEQKINEEKEIEISELKGHMISGEVTDADSGKKIAIRLAVLSGKPFGTFMLLGSVPFAEKDEMVPEIEKVITSFEIAK